MSELTPLLPQTQSRKGGSILTSYLIQALNIGTGVILANALSPHERGTLAAAVLLPPILLAVGSLGMGESLTYHLAGSRTETKEALAAALAVAAMAGVAATGVTMLIAARVYSQYSHTAFIIYSLYPPISALSAVAIQALLGLGRVLRYNVARASIQAVTILLLLVGRVTTSLTASDVAVIYLAAELVTAVFAWALLRTVPAPRVRGATLRAITGFGSKASLGIVATVFIERGDQLILAKQLAPAQLGFYAVAASVAGAVTIIGATLGPLALAQVPAAAGERQRGVVLRATAATAIVSSIAAALLIAICPTLVGTLMGEYTEAVPVARTLCVAAVSIGCNRVLSSGLKGMGRPVAAGAAQLAVAAMTLCALYWAASLWGLRGAAVTLMVGGTATSFVLTMLVLANHGNSLGGSVGPKQ